VTPFNPYKPPAADESQETTQTPSRQGQPMLLAVILIFAIVVLMLLARALQLS